ncbi:facilitated trehalose transporter Tret1 isoform X2 [Bemisia tabaci]
MMTTMPTLVIGALHKNSAGELNMNDDQASWFGSIIFFAHPIGALISGYLQERFGRRGSMILVNVPVLAAWLTLYAADSVYQLHLVSVLMGLCVGFCEAPLHSYIGEIAEPHLRGTISTLVCISGHTGGVLLHVLGYLAQWRTTALFCGAVPAITFFAMTQIPESPTWLILNSRLKEAQKALGWVRGWVEAEVVHEEFQRLLEHAAVAPKSRRVSTFEGQKYEMVPLTEDGTPQKITQETESFLRIKYRELSDQKMFRPLRMVFIVFIFSFATQLMGMRPFLVNIFNEFGLQIDSQLVVALTRFSLLVGAILNVTLLRRFGKRRLTLLCQAAATVSIILLGVYCSFFDETNRNASLSWIPISLMTSVYFFIGFSLTILPWQLCAEVFPIRGRGAAQGLSAGWSYYVRFGMSVTYLYLEKWIRLSGVFYLYGVISVIGFWYYWRYLPETEGKSLEQIESYFTDDHDKTEKFSRVKSK